jgi:hypothetical protein
MEEGQQDPSGSYGMDPYMKMRELEEKQRILKERIMLIGQNLVEQKEKNQEYFTEIQKQLEILKQSMSKVRNFLEMASREFSKFARKEEVEILRKQARIFQL